MSGTPSFELLSSRGSVCIDLGLLTFVLSPSSVLFDSFGFCNPPECNHSGGFVLCYTCQAYTIMRPGTLWRAICRDQQNRVKCGYPNLSVSAGGVIIKHTLWSPPRHYDVKDKNHPCLGVITCGIGYRWWASLILRNSDGDAKVPYANWNGTEFNRNANRLDNDWNSNYRVALLVTVLIFHQFGII